MSIQVALNPGSAGYSREQLPDLYRRLLARFDSVPGIRSTGMSTSGFRAGTSRTCCVAIQGYIPMPGDEREVQTMTVTLDYFRTMGVPILSGRSYRRAGRARRCGCLPCPDWTAATETPARSP